MDAFAIPFSLVWFGGVIYAFTRQISNPDPPPAWAFKGGFVAMGLYVTVGRFVLDAWRRRRTTYWLTTERVFIATAEPFGSLKSLDLRTLSNVRLIERTPRVPTFERIPNAKAVYDLVRSRVPTR